MFTLPTRHGGPHGPPSTRDSHDEQIRQDRWTAVVFFTLMIALMGLILWLATLAEPVPVQPNDFWHMMP